MKRGVALFPGSFDPITKGHVELLRISLNIFDKVIVGVGNNSSKRYMFSVGDRVEMVNLACEECGLSGKVEVIEYGGLTVELCRRFGIGVIVRGVRTQSDFQFEYDIAVNNYMMAPEIQTIFIPSPPHLANIRSSIVRELINLGADLSFCLPSSVINFIRSKYGRNG